MKVSSLFMIATTGLLALTVPASTHVLPNFVDNSSIGTISDDNNTNTGGNTNNSTQVSTDLGKFNGTWYVISMEEDIYKEMQKVARKYNTSCTCPQMSLVPAGPAALNANVSCTLQINDSNTQVLSHGLLTLLPGRRSNNNKTKNQLWKQRATGNDSSSSQEYSFALLFSRLYIDSNDITLANNGNQSDHLPNLSQGFQLPQVDSGVKGNLFWSFFSSKNGSSPDDVAFVRSKHMVSGDNKHDVPDVNMLLSKSQTLFDDASYNETAPSIPGIGKNYKWDYVKLDKCNVTSSSDGQQPEATSSINDQPAQATETSDEATSTTTSDQQPTSSTQGDQGQSTTTGGGGDGSGNDQQPQATETTDGSGDQQQPQPTETNANSGGDQQQPQPSETNSGDQQQQQPSGGQQ